jgi:DNA uptake protein ComE-like DNA-binding protein
MEPHKRPAEANVPASRPFKRTADHTSRVRSNEAGLTKESIEALISQRIDEKLAERALQDAGTAPALSAELQKRLDDLEHRIDAQADDEKGQGLQFLLMAKQHVIRGEDASALRMYHLALPFFPGNSKLLGKMEALEERIRNKKVAGVGVKMEEPASSTGPLKAQNKASRPYTAINAQSEMEIGPMDDDFAPQESDHDDSYASDTSSKYTRTVRKPKKVGRKLPVFRDMAADQQSGPPTPKTAQLLKIINSRDVSQIKTLVGVGAKKADAIVSSLLEMEDEEIRDLEGLANLRGLSGNSVEKMRMGVWAGF